MTKLRRTLLLVMAVVLPVVVFSFGRQRIFAQNAPVRNAAANIAANPGFEEADGKLPAHWYQDEKLKGKGSVFIDALVRVSGHSSLRLDPNETNSDKDHLLSMGQIVSAENLKGRRFRLSGSVRNSPGAVGTLAALALDASGKPVGIGFVAQPTPTEEFVVQDTFFAVPQEAVLLIIACVATGTSGSTWFDDVSFTLSEPQDTPPSSEELRASVTVDTRTVTRNVPRNLFGTNIEWIWDANGIWNPDRHEVRPEILRPTREMGLDNIRFPGGLFSDYYHWRDGIGPRESRPMRPNSPGDKGVSRNEFGTDELMEFCRAAGAEPLLTVNCITGTAAEAADWVRYCNQTRNAERAANGHEEPYAVKLWEVGNEQYIRGDDPVGRNSYLPTDEYVTRYVKWSSEMRKVDPSIRIGAVGGSNFSRYALVHDADWNRKLLQRAGSSIDFLAVHNGYAPVGAASSSATFYEVYGAMLAFPKLMERNFRTLNSQIETYAAAHAGRIRIAVTEWALLFDFTLDSRWIDHCKTLASGVYAADILRTFLTADRVDIANSFKLTENNFMGWIGETGVPKPSYYAQQMYARHFGTKVVSTQVHVPAYDSTSVAMIESVKEVPYLEVISSLSEDASRLYIIAINKHFAAPITTDMRVCGFLPEKGARAWVLTGPSADANNGPDLPDFPGFKWAEQVKAPANSWFDKGEPGSVVTRLRDFEVAGPIFSFTFPPMSVTSLELTRR